QVPRGPRPRAPAGAHRRGPDAGREPHRGARGIGRHRAGSHRAVGRAMLTSRGWVAAVAAVCLAVTGRILGIYELFLLAAGAGALVLVALVTVRTGRVRLRGVRQLHPPRVHCGSDSRVELVLANQGRRTT